MLNIRVLVYQYEIQLIADNEYSIKKIVDFVANLGVCIVGVIVENNPDILFEEEFSFTEPDELLEFLINLYRDNLPEPIIEK